MFNMVNIYLSIILPDWKEKLLSDLTDGTCNITGRYQGVVTCLDNASMKMLEGVLCGAHNIDLVMGEIFSIVVKYQFYYVMTGFIL